MIRSLVVLLLAGCKGSGSVELPKDEADTDSDTDSDTDADTDTDTDTDTVAPTDTADTDRIPFLFDAAHVLVVPTNDGVSLLANDGTTVHTWTWQSLVGSCASCTGEGSSPDGDGLLVSWAGIGANQGVARIGVDGAAEWVVKGMEFPHDAIRDNDGSFLVPEAFDNSVRWYAGDGSSEEPIRTLNASTDGWTQNLTNGTERVDYNGRTYLLVSNRGAGMPLVGRITMWDITDAGFPTFVWTYPANGSLDTPHCPIYRFHDGQWYLLYAHSYGGPGGDGSVGVAVTADPTVLPEYVADLLPAAPVGPFDFLRGVELTEDGTLWLTDSGSEFGGAFEGRVVSAPLPALAPPDGSIGNQSDQDFVELTGAALVAEGLDNPFEGWLWLPTVTY